MTDRTKKLSPTSASPKKKGGRPRKLPRPTEPTEDLVIELFTRYVSGESLDKMLRGERKFPSWATFLAWVSKGEARQDPRYIRVAERYLRARQAKADKLFEEMQDIERRMQVPRKLPNPEFDTSQKAGPDNPREIENPEYLDPNTARVLLDSIKWRLAKMKPEKYADRQHIGLAAEIRHTTPADEAPDWLKDAIERHTPKPVSSRGKPKDDQVH